MENNRIYIGAVSRIDADKEVLDSLNLVWNSGDKDTYKVISSEARAWKYEYSCYAIVVEGNRASYIFKNTIERLTKYFDSNYSSFPVTYISQVLKESYEIF